MSILHSTASRERMERSGAILASVLDKVAAAVRPGISTLELDAIAEAAIREHSGEPGFQGYRGFPRTLCVSINDEVVHGIPRQERRLASGDIVGLDLGVRYQGWYTDAALTVGVGQISAEAQRLIDVAREALRRAMAVVRPGVTTGDVGSTVQRFVESTGFGVVRDLSGHGVGRRLHDEPSLPNFGTAGSGPRLQEGMALALEPMITAGGYQVRVDPDGWTVRTRDGSRSAHFEQTVVVTADGCRTLTPYGSAPGD